ncbi:MAG: exodeoxyribonuclease VII large subunit [Acidobacteria bacterium]|nr:exodeoxyribonuclease VII large subunit [Acidobacteriota bacterium]
MSSLFDQLFEDDAPVSKTTPEAVGPAPRTVLSVTDLTVRVRDHLEAAFFEVWVEGELSNCRLWSTGHLYFTLKDSSAQIRGIIFRPALRYLKFKPTDGLRVVARGRVSVYEPKGEYQLVCEHLEPHGLGARQLAFEQLKKRLQAEGLFEAARKRPLPALPRKIGIVTSLDGAAIRDIINVLGRRYANLQLVIRPTRVQGEGAALEIASALAAIGRVPDIDVIIVGRGGGSIEDLWAFNDERVARAIAEARVPVISAVGHETDVTIADFVADVRAPTPSAAAEIVVAAKNDFTARIDRLQGRLLAAMRGRVQGLSRRVHMLDGRPTFAGVPGRVAMRGRHAAELSHALARAARAALSSRERQLQLLQRQLDTLGLGRRLATIRARLVSADGRMGGAMGGRRLRARGALRESVSRLEALSPLGVLGRGYALCWTADRTHVVRDASVTAPGDRVRVTLAKGELECEVRAVSEE